MARVLVLTTDLPYFPGKMGVDFFNLRHLAESHQVSIVAPCYDWYPNEGVANLLQFMRGGAHLWPEATGHVTPFTTKEYNGQLPPWISRLSSDRRQWILYRLLRLEDRPGDAFDKLAVLANCAAHLLHALSVSPSQAMVLIQTSLEPWLDYLPAIGGKLVYFHDVRADYLDRAIPLPGQSRLALSEIAAIRNQEQRIAEQVDVVAFVSELDLQRANRLFRMRAASGVAPIPVDTEYYTPPPADWVRDTRPVVLFTGHLLHPPNVDAVLYFLREIWPAVHARVPSAVFQIVGMMPAEAVQNAASEAPQCELHPNVPDIRPYFWNAGVYVVPMRYGGGVRQKLFEAWSMGVPVVCTTMAAEGTGVENGTQCWLEDAPDAFAERIVSLLASDQPSVIASAAKRHVESNNSIAAAAPRFQSLVEKAVHINRQRPYKLLFDLRWMEIGKAGGMEQATYELISAIGQWDRRNSYRLFAPRNTCCEWNFPSGFDVRLHYSNPAERHIEALKSFLVNRLAESLALPALLNPAMRTLAEFRRMDFNLVHSVCGYTHPDLIDLPGILTIHDLQHLHYPQFFAPGEWEERERLYRESATRARHIICISEFTRQDVHRQYGIPLEKMTTIWNIPSRHIWRQLAAGEVQSLLARMGLAGPFLFFPAHCWPHKNHAKLIEAYRLVAADLPGNLKLVFTGRAFPDDHPAAELIREPGLRNRIVHLGYRSPLEMRALFQGCLGLVFPSLFEGYGMPVAEALIAGKPVACSNATSLPEIAGEAALTFNPHDAADIGIRLFELATQPDLRAALSDSALRRRTLFSARRSALQTLAVYHRVHDETYGA
jgi:glycosyltransferase involved in cell wall biosynthesis